MMSRLLSLSILILILSCSSSENNAEESKKADRQIEDEVPQLYLQYSEENTYSEERNGIILKAVGTEMKYPNASLILDSYHTDESSNNTVFNFDLNDFQLGEQTEGERNQLLAASDQGQHIHFILNNGPYSAHYEPTIEKDLAEGNNVILSFLARSYHESVKGEQAFVFRNISIGKDNPPFDLSSPHLIYSQPKGVYQSKIDPILLDFYLINAELSDDGMKVKAKIDDEEFILNSWQPYLIYGLEEGEHNIRLQLIDQDGNVVQGPFNDSGERTITLKILGISTESSPM